MADKATQQQQQQQQQGKVLRIGIVQEGRVIHERLIRPGQNVTVGESPKNTFVFSAKNLPKRFTLFQAKGDTYLLNFTDEMKGKIAQNEGVAGLEQLRKSGQAARKGASHALLLAHKNRGKVEIDQVTVLFQFVAAPPESARMVHRQDYRPRLLDEDDPVFLGFLGLWTAVATALMIYVFSTEPLEMMPFEDIPDRFVDIILPKTEATEATDLTLETDESKSEEVAKKEEEREASKKPKRELTEEEKAAEEARRVEQRKADVLAKSKLLAGIIGTKGETTSDATVEDVFAEGDGNFQDLQSALQTVGGVEQASERGLAMRGQSDGGGRGDASIGDLKASGAGGKSEVGSVKTKAPTGALSMGSIEAGSGEYEDKIRATLRKYSGQIKYCYEARLKENPNIAGRLAIELNVAAGRVTSVSISENSTGDSALEGCVKGKARAWRFPTEITDNIFLPFALSPS